VQDREGQKVQSTPAILLFASPADEITLRQAAELRTAGWQVLAAHDRAELDAIADSSQPVDLLLLRLSAPEGLDPGAARRFLDLRPVPLVCLVREISSQESAALGELPGYGLLPADAGGSLLTACVSMALRAAESLRQAEAARLSPEKLTSFDFQALQEEFCRVVESTQNPIFVVDRSYRLVLANQSFQNARLAAGASQLAPGDPLLSADFSPQEWETWQGLFDRALAGEAFHTQARYPGQGAEMVYDHTFNPLQDDQGCTQGVLVISHDISQLANLQETLALARDELEQQVAQRTAELAERSEKLRQSEQHFRLALKAAPLVIFNQDTGLRYTWLGTAPIGFTEQEVLGKTDAELLDPENSAPLDQFKRRVMESRMGGRGEFLISSRGGARYFDLIVEPLFSPSGEVTGITCATFDITERKLAEIALRESHIRLDLALEAADMGTFRMEVGQKMPVIDDRTRRLFGIDPHRSRGTAQELRDAILPEDLPRALAEMSENLKSSATMELQFRVTWPDGSLHYLAARGRAILDQQGQPIGVHGVLWDNSERILAEQALRESEEKYRALFNNELYAIAIVDMETQRILDTNEAHLRMFGYTREELISGMTLADLNADSTGLTTDLDQLGQSGSVFVPQRLGKRRDGSLFTAEVATGKYTWKGRPVLFGILRDISDRLQAEQALRESEEKYRVVFNNEIYAIVLIDLETLCILDVNDTFVRLYGYSREELTGGMSMLDITAEPDRTREKVHDIEQMGTIFNPLRHHRKKDGAVFPVEQVGGQFTWKGRQVVFLMNHDISDRRKAELQVQQLLKDNELLLREVHHRIKNNMSTIASLLALQSYALSDPIAIQALEDASGRVHSMMTIYELLYRATDLQRVNLHTYLDILLGKIASTLTTPGLEISLVKELEAVDAPVGLCFPLGIVTNELVTNAYKYAFSGRSHGQVRVTLRRSGQALELSVKDDGVGLPAQLDPLSADTFGLGLVNILARQIKAEVQVMHQDGTTFILRVPIADPD
jgi:PAS domain S-box-containing protein